MEIVLERAHPVDESSDASSAVISSDTVIKTLIFQKTDVVMMNVADVNLDYPIIGKLLITNQKLGHTDVVYWVYSLLQKMLVR